MTAPTANTMPATTMTTMPASIAMPHRSDPMSALAYVLRNDSFRISFRERDSAETAKGPAVTRDP